MTWDESLVAFDRDMRARSLAERTRRAYGVDLGQFVEWARTRGLEPAGVRHREVRRFAAALSAEGASAATVGRKLAAVRCSTTSSSAASGSARTRPTSSPAPSASRSCRAC